MADSTTTSDLPQADRRQWLALVTVCIGTLMIVLDTTIVNVALPKIQDDLHFSQSSLTWTVNAYLISFGSFLLIAGRMGDLFGRKRMFLYGLIGFVTASILCGVAPSQGILIAGRFLQGFGGALASASVLAIIYTEFPREDEQTRAMGVYTFVIAVSGGSIGLLLGGVIVDSLDWHWIFFINVPIGIVTYLAGTRLIEESEKQKQDGALDYFGAALVTVSVAIGVYAIVGAVDHGWGSLQTLGLGALSAIGIAGFLAYEHRVANPIMPLRILRARGLMYSNWIRGGMVVGMFATFFLGALYFEKALGYSPLKIGFAFLPITLIIAGLGLGPTAWATERFGIAKVVLFALPFAVAGLLILSTVDQHTGYFPTLFIAFALLGFGVGLSFTPLVMLAMRDIEAEDAGLASGLVNVSMQLAGAFGLAILTSISTERTKSLVTDGKSQLDGLIDGYQLAYLVAAIAVASAIVLMALAAREPKAAEEQANTGAGDLSAEGA